MNGQWTYRCWSQVNVTEFSNKNSCNSVFRFCTHAHTVISLCMHIIKYFPCRLRPITVNFRTIFCCSCWAKSFGEFEWIIYVPNFLCMVVGISSSIDWFAFKSGSSMNRSLKLAERCFRLALVNCNSKLVITIARLNDPLWRGHSLQF